MLSGREELARYKALEVPAAYDSPLVFWREHKREHPVLSEVARRVLCISASSAQSERDFSCVGHTITDTRSIETVSRESGSSRVDSLGVACRVNITITALILTI